MLLTNMLIKHDKAPLCLTYPLFAGQEGGRLCSGAAGGAQFAVGFGRGYKLLVVRSVTRLTR